MTEPRTLAEKVWSDHLVVKGTGGEPDLIYIDLHLVHEVTSPQAFDGLRQAGRPVRRPDLTIATEDHNTPTIGIDQPIAGVVLADRLHRSGARVGIADYGRIGLEFDHLIDAQEMLVQLRKGPKEDDRYRAPAPSQHGIGPAQLRLAKAWGVTVGLSVPEAVQPRRRRP